MEICQTRDCNNPTKGSRKLCSECNKKITERRVDRTVCKFEDELLMKIKNSKIQNDFRKKLWQTFKPMFSIKLKQEIKKKKEF